MADGSGHWVSVSVRDIQGWAGHRMDGKWLVGSVGSPEQERITQKLDKVGSRQSREVIGDRPIMDDQKQNKAKKARHSIKSQSWKQAEGGHR